MNPKGSKDYLNNEQELRKKIRNTLIEVFEYYGCEEMETPALCYYDILASKYAGGTEILKEVYKFSDQGERSLALRYDLTIPFARVIGMNSQMKMPFKRYEIGKVFRDGPVKKGRLREFVQCDVDIVGISSLLAEAEIIAMIVDVFNELQLDIYISLNNRKLLSGLLYAMDIAEEKINDIILSLDKVDKYGIKAVSEELLEKNIDQKIITDIINLLNSSEQLKEIEKNYTHPILNEGIEEINQLIHYLQELGIEDKVRHNPFLARGLDIYTGTVYEVFLADQSISSSIASGGRYDQIIGAFLNTANKYPAIGVSFGLDVIYQTLIEKEHLVKSIIDLYIIPLNTDLEALKLASQLRKKQVRVELEMTERKLKKSLDYANKKNIPYVLILGEDEISLRKIKIKNMQTGTEIEISIDDFVANPQEYLKA